MPTGIAAATPGTAGSSRATAMPVLACGVWRRVCGRRPGVAGRRGLRSSAPDGVDEREDAPLHNTDLVSVIPICLGHRFDGSRELFTSFPSREQVHILARSIENSVCLDCVTSGKSEAVLLRGLEPDLCEAPVDLVHYPASRCG